jgi:hypothetical protein
MNDGINKCEYNLRFCTSWFMKSMFTGNMITVKLNFDCSNHASALISGLYLDVGKY